MKKLLSLLLAVCLFITGVVSVYADAPQEIYLSELRLVYADSYDEARESLRTSEFSDYELLNKNLNDGSGKTGVWLAYKTTTDIEDAITDISVMQMNGGYREGNYQEMVKQSRERYEAMSEIYLEAIEYFEMAYNSGHFLSESAYRQLNLYADYDDHDGARIGDLFAGGIDAPELAILFMEGNSHALKNIRSLLAMGVSYNEDGKTYLEHVEIEAEKMMAEGEAAFEDHDRYIDFDDLALLISATVTTFREMFKELATVEDELKYENTEEISDQELIYVEYKAIADMLRGVDYLDGKTLYEFCLTYENNNEDLTSLYPLVAALNEGQLAMTQTAHYYDVVCYSMSEIPEDLIDEQITELEQKHGGFPFNVYAGVDRSIFQGTFALTNEAYRADAYTESGLQAYLQNSEYNFGAIIFGFAAATACSFLYATYRFAYSPFEAAEAASQATDRLSDATIGYVDTLASKTGFYGEETYGDMLYNLASQNKEVLDQFQTVGQSFADQYTVVANAVSQGKISLGSHGAQFSDLQMEMSDAGISIDPLSGGDAAQESTQAVASTSVASGAVTAALYVFSAVMLIATAVTLIIAISHYKHPEYDDIPAALVDVRSTEDGDRYIKYDAVMEAESDENGQYTPGDLNAFTAERWNALYYTKSYEAGKPLLATFALSNDNYVPAEQYLPVHRFGEEVCYNLNKYHFSSDAKKIYLSVKQSENQKAAVADVPQVVGTLFGNGFYFLAAGIGAILGVGATIGAQTLSKKKESNAD